MIVWLVFLSALAVVLAARVVQDATRLDRLDRSFDLILESLEQIFTTHIAAVEEEERQELIRRIRHHRLGLDERTPTP